MKKLLLILLILSTQLFSKVIIVHTTGKYTMSDADTKINSRKIALEYAKSNAIEEAGVVITSEFNSNTDSNGKDFSKSDIKTYSSGIIKTKILNTSIVNNVYIVNIEAKIDTSNLNKYQSMSTELKTKLTNIESKNDELINRLKILEKQLTKTSNKLNTAINDNKDVDVIENKITTIIKERKLTLKKISKNRKQIIFYIEKGTLGGILNDYKIKLENAKNDIQENIFDYYKNNLDVKISNLNVVPNGNGTANVTFDVTQSINHKHIDNIMSKYFRVYDSVDIKGGRYQMELNSEDEYKYSNQADDYLNPLPYTKNSFDRYSNEGDYKRVKKHAMKLLKLRDTFSLWDAQNTVLSRELFGWLKTKTLIIKFSVNKKYFTNKSLYDLALWYPFKHGPYRTLYRNGEKILKKVSFLRYPQNIPKKNERYSTSKNEIFYASFITNRKFKIFINNIPEEKLSDFNNIKVEIKEK